MSKTFLSPKAIKFAHDTLQSFPRPDHAAAEALRTWMRSHGLDLDPDKVDAVTLHYQFHVHSWVGYVANRMTMTQAMLSNWQGEHQDWLGHGAGYPWPSQPIPQAVTILDPKHLEGIFDSTKDFYVYNGLFQRTDPPVYGWDNHVSLSAEDFINFVWYKDFHIPYRQMLDEYWKQGLENYRHAAQIAFVAACNKQMLEGSLSEAARQLAWQVAGLKPRETKVQVAPLNIYGYPATSLLCIKHHASGLTLLYIPGNSSPLHEFATESLMKTWVAQQCKDARKRMQLMQHFAPQDLADGLDFSGLETALQGLGAYPHSYLRPADRPGFTTDGLWNPQQYINYKVATYSPPIEGDVFLAIAQRQQSRSYEDADAIITTDASINKTRWRGYMASALTILAPLALVSPWLGLLFAAGGIAQFGLGLDQVINGKTAEEKAEGVQYQAYGLLNALPLAHAPFAEDWQLFEFRSASFVQPRLINDQWGYPLSGDPALAAKALSPLEEAFQLDMSALALDSADSAVADAVTRNIGPDGRVQLEASLLYDENMLAQRDVYYDARTNLFAHAESGVWTFYSPEAESPGLVKAQDLPSADSVTDLSRQQRLRALGIDLQLPVDLSAYSELVRTEIPKTFSSVWIGNRKIGEAYLEAISHNTEVLADTSYEYRLYLSSRSPEYAHNLRTLEQRAPGLKVLELEDQAFYKDFQNSKYFEQYRAATDASSPGVNYSSASDILRYRLLNAEGGIYLDCDDRLLAHARGAAEGTLVGIDQVSLSTTQDGLLLNPPVVNPRLGMLIKYNTSLIGSHAGNPTLDAISDEILQRYQGNRDFYRSRPAANDTEKLYQYSLELNRMTGPGVVNDVIDAKLGWLKQLRELCAFLTCPHANGEQVIDLAHFLELEGQLLPLRDHTQIGSVHSWLST
ncbi:dermonecrotic toxin domain-containing protein [Pseudomonas sp. NPDC090755]|uniref:dermonecrotic toxin domain-containing protein n=1 Tax=Pseudomonas sp. NPDC090755 TaxID=3364481 RepID=UPI00383B4E91